MTLQERACLGGAVSSARAAERREAFAQILRSVEGKRSPIKQAARIANVSYRTARRYAAAARQGD